MVLRVFRREAGVSAQPQMQTLSIEDLYKQGLIQLAAIERAGVLAYQAYKPGTSEAEALKIMRRDLATRRQKELDSYLIRITQPGGPDNIHFQREHINAIDPAIVKDLVAFIHGNPATEQQAETGIFSRFVPESVGDFLKKKFAAVKEARDAFFEIEPDLGADYSSALAHYNAVWQNLRLLHAAKTGIPFDRKISDKHYIPKLYRIHVSGDASDIAGVNIRETLLAAFEPTFIDSCLLHHGGTRFTGFSLVSWGNNDRAACDQPVCSIRIRHYHGRDYWDVGTDEAEAKEVFARILHAKTYGEIYRACGYPVLSDQDPEVLASSEAPTAIEHTWEGNFPGGCFTDDRCHPNATVRARAIAREAEAAQQAARAEYDAA